MGCPSRRSGVPDSATRAREVFLCLFVRQRARHFGHARARGFSLGSPTATSARLHAAARARLFSSTSTKVTPPPDPRSTRHAPEPTRVGTLVAQASAGGRASEQRPAPRPTHNSPLVPDEHANHHLGRETVHHEQGAAPPNPTKGRRPAPYQPGATPRDTRSPTNAQGLKARPIHPRNCLHPAGNSARSRPPFYRRARPTAWQTLNSLPDPALAPPLQGLVPELQTDR